MKKRILSLAACVLAVFAFCQAQPTLTISAVSNISANKAQLNANISSLGGWTVNQKGFFVSMTPDFASATKITSLEGTGKNNTATGNYYYYPGATPSTSKPFFRPATTYYVKTFAKKGSGSTADTVFSNVISFTTLAAQGGVCSADSVGNIGYTAAKVYGRAQSLNDAYKISKTGAVIGMSPSVTTADGLVYTATVSTTTLPKSYNIDVSGLNQGVTYYFRTWISNQYTTDYFDTTYSTPISFNTLCAVDSVPSNVTFDNITTTTADVSWTPRTGQYLFEIEYGYAGHTVGEGTILPCEGNHITLTGLDAGRSYTVYVRSTCSTGAVGEWTPVRAFTTIASLCANVTGVHTTDLTYSFAKIEWVPGSMSQTAWELLFAKASENYPANPFLVTGTPMYSPIGLQPNTQYKVRVRANCDPYYSDWSDDFRFTTLVMGLDEAESEAKVTIYPNPSDGGLRFDVKNTEVEYMNIYNSLGVKVFSCKEIPEELVIRDAGVYYVVIGTSKGVQSEKIIIR